MPVAQLNQVLQGLRRAAGACAELNDSSLLAEFIARRDEEAFERLVRRHGPMVLSVCRGLIGHHQDAEDAFQAVFLVLARKAPCIQPADRLAGWLYGVAYRTALEARRRRARRTAREVQVSQMPEPTPPAAPSNVDDLAAVLAQELARLPERYRLPVILCELEGQPRRDAAQQLHLPEGTLSSRLATARRLLAGRLARRGFAASGYTVAAILAQQGASAALPPLLLRNTVRAACQFAAGSAALVSQSVSLLAQGVIKAMFGSQGKLCAILVLAVAVLIGSHGVLCYAPLAAQDPGVAEPGKPADPRGPKPDKKETPAPKAQPPAPKEATPVQGLKERLRKYEDEVVRLRGLMLKEIAEEEKKLTAQIKKIQEDMAAARRDLEARRKAFSALTRARQDLLKVQQARTHVEMHIRLGAADTARRALPAEQRLGLQVASPSRTLIDQVGLAKGQGLVVERVTPDSPAGKAGVKTHDILLQLDRKTVASDLARFRNALSEVKAATVDLVVLRQGKKETLKIQNPNETPSPR
jgi:RNA polymerase sigma factor (sigma-70 family)